ncbi:hypothetical protein LXL04_035570 [Taraxacum kok-saghyz]
MNANEVIANTAADILGHKHGDKLYIQTTMSKDHSPQITNEFSDIVKIGRTHTQEATPLTHGPKFSAYTTQVKYGIERVLCSFPRMYQVHRFDVKIAATVADEERLPG